MFFLCSALERSRPFDEVLWNWPFQLMLMPVSRSTFECFQEEIEKVEFGWKKAQTKWHLTHFFFEANCWRIVIFLMRSGASQMRESTKGTTFANWKRSNGDCKIETKHINDKYRWTLPVEHFMCRLDYESYVNLWFDFRTRPLKHILNDLTECSARNRTNWFLRLQLITVVALSVTWSTFVACRNWPNIESRQRLQHFCRAHFLHLHCIR